jgi:hypothetical protein
MDRGESVIRHDDDAVKNVLENTVNQGSLSRIAFYS